MPARADGGRPIHQLLDALAAHERAVKPSGPNRWMAFCPSHDDGRTRKKPSLSVGETAGGVVLVHCFAGCATEAVVRAVGLRMRDLYPDDFRPRWQPSRPHAPVPSPERRIVAEYVYTDATDAPLFKVVRREPKDFRAYRHDPTAPDGWTGGMGDVRPVLYHLPAVRRAVASGEVVHIVEGEKDCDRLNALGLTATTNAFGAGKWRDDYSAALAGADVVILPDNDAPGRAHADQVAASLHGVARSVRVLALVGLPAKGDLSDWLDLGYTVTDLQILTREVGLWTPTASPPPAPAPAASVEALAADEEQDHPTTRRRLDVVRASEVTPRPVEWIWPQWIPLGYYGELGGPPGLGKSTVAYDLLARLSRGAPFPDGTPCTPITVAILAAEDLIDSVVVPRLIKADADLDRVVIVRGVLIDMGSAGTVEHDSLSLPLDLGQLRAQMQADDVRFIYADALTDLLPKFESHRETDTRQVLRPLATFARELAVSVMGVRHFNKSPGLAAVHASNGSVAFSAVARFMLQAHPDPKDADRRVLAVAKSNYSALPDSLAFRPVAESPTAIARIAWLGTDPRSANDLLAEAAAARQSGDGGGPNADQWLAGVLMDGVSDQREILKAANAAGFATRTVYRASDRLRVERTVTGFGEAKRSAWHLPTPAQFCHESAVLPYTVHGNTGNTGGPVAKLDDADPDEIARQAMEDGV